MRNNNENSELPRRFAVFVHSKLNEEIFINMAKFRFPIKKHIALLVFSVIVLILANVSDVIMSFRSLKDEQSIGGRTL